MRQQGELRHQRSAFLQSVFRGAFFKLGGEVARFNRERSQHPAELMRGLTQSGCVLRLERGSLMSLTAEHPQIGVAIIGELGQRLHGMNRSLAYLTYAANALGRDEYDPAMLAELTRQPGELGHLHLRRLGHRIEWKALLMA